MQAAQQTEVYWMALARDIPFSQFATNDLIALAAGTPDHMRRQIVFFFHFSHPIYQLRTSVFLPP